VNGCSIAFLSGTMGFVETRPQSGTYVRDFLKDGSLDILVSVLRVRRTIEWETLDSLLRYRFTTETVAAAEAAARAGAGDIGRLERILERKRGHLKEVPSLIQCDFDFHYAVITLSGDVISRLVFKSFEPIYSFSPGSSTRCRRLPPSRSR
jgi:GntR family transcriptional regulator, transcriptional repressor for pyruvate dehydrogenase complex